MPVFDPNDPLLREQELQERFKRVFGREMTPEEVRLFLLSGDLDAMPQTMKQASSQ